MNKIFYGLCFSANYLHHGSLYSDRLRLFIYPNGVPLSYEASIFEESHLIKKHMFIYDMGNCKLKNENIFGNDKYLALFYG